MDIGVGSDAPKEPRPEYEQYYGLHRAWCSLVKFQNILSVEGQLALRSEVRGGIKAVEQALANLKVLYPELLKDDNVQAMDSVSLCGVKRPISFDDIS